jgi:hypothetical protein
MPIGYRAHMADVPSTTTSPAAPALLFGHLTAGEPGPPSPGRSRTGVVWVHGIGDQKPGDSLFDWTRPILDTFAEWRRDHDDHHPDDVVGENPVTAASVSDPDNRWIAVDIPAFRSRPRAEWLFTEAYWAGDVRPPSFSAAAAYLLGHLRMIIGFSISSTNIPAIRDSPSSSSRYAAVGGSRTPSTSSGRTPSFDSA